MTIDEAITILKARLQDVLANRSDRSAKACRLGIEALERLKDTRKSNPEAMPKLAYHSYLEPLPSEGEKV